MEQLWHEFIQRLNNSMVKRWRIALFLLIGILVRVLPVLQSNYPLGEGGLFYYIIQYIAEQRTLPREVPYYSCGLPFAYPPLGLVVYGLVLRYTSLSLFTILQWSAPFFSVLSLLAFALLAARFLKGLARDLAILSFATIPAVVAHITAADSIRNMALFLMLVGLSLLHEVLSQDISDRALIKKAIAAGLCIGLVILIHPSIAVGTITVTLLFVLYFVCTRRTWVILRVVLLVLSTTFIIGLIWPLVLYELHGTRFLPLLANALGSRPYKSIWLLTLLNLGATDEPFADFWAVTGSIGLIYGLLSGNPLPAIWFLVTPIHWSNQVYAVPLAIGAGWGLGEVIVPLINQKPSHLRKILVSLLFVALVGYVILGALTFSIRPETPLIGRLWGNRGMQPQISDARLEAWAWMANHLPENAQVILVAEEKEWVPAFGHICANIPQGAEWVGKFLYYGELYNKLISVSTAEDLLTLLHEHQQPIEYLYLSTKLSPQFRTAVANRGGNLYTLKRTLDELKCTQLLFENTEVVVYNIQSCASLLYQTYDSSDQGAK